MSDDNVRIEVNEVEPIQEGTGRKISKPKTSLLNNKKMTDEQKHKLQMALSDMSGSSQLKVINPDPNYYYYFASKNPSHPQSVGAISRLGYEIVNRENNSGEELPFGDVESTQGGALQNHELVLMRIPIEYKEARDKWMSDEGHRRIETSEEELEERAERLQRGEVHNTNRRTFVFGS